MTKANEPAFPVTAPENGYIQGSGMSLRTYLAGQAMMGLLGWYTIAQLKAGACVDVAEVACLIADATINELNKTEK